MIIDSHVHIEELPGEKLQASPELVLEQMKEADIDISIVMTYSDAPCEWNPEGIDYVAKSVAKYPDKLIGYARMNPAAGEKAIEIFEHAVKDLNYKGLKLHPVSTWIPPHSELTINLIKKATEFGLPTLFHCGDEEMTLPLQVARAAELCPESVIILGHMGGYFHFNDAIKVAKKYPNIYLETSAMPYPNVIKRAVEEISAERVLFASDGPGCLPKLEVHKVKLAGLTKEEEELIFYKNIKRILNL